VSSTLQRDDVEKLLTLITKKLSIRLKY